MKLKYLTTARLIQVLAGEVVDLKKFRDKKNDETNRDEKILRALEKQGGFEEDDQMEMDQKKVWEKKPKRYRELGLINFDQDWTEAEEVAQNFLNETEGLENHDEDMINDLAKTYDEEYPKLDLYDYLMRTHREGEVPTTSQEVFFLLYPEEAYGVESVGPSINLLTPDENKLEEAIEQALKDGYDFIVLYGDDDQTYNRMFQKIKKEYEVA